MNYMRELHVLFYDLIKLGCRRFCNVLLNVQDTDFQRALAEGDLQYVADFYIIGRFCGSAVGGHMCIITSIIGDGTALNDAGNLKKFIQSHF